MLDTLLEVTEEMNVRNDPPAGMLVHTLIERDGASTS
jgi:hypothetical protein